MQPANVRQDTSAIWEKLIKPTYKAHLFDEVSTPFSRVTISSVGHRFHSPQLWDCLFFIPGAKYPPVIRLRGIDGLVFLFKPSFPLTYGTVEKWRTFKRYLDMISILGDSSKDINQLFASVEIIVSYPLWAIVTTAAESWDKSHHYFEIRWKRRLQQPRTCHKWVCNLFTTPPLLAGFVLFWTYFSKIFTCVLIFFKLMAPTSMTL